jgi:hypothetical protein
MRRNTGWDRWWWGLLPMWFGVCLALPDVPAESFLRPAKPDSPPALSSSQRVVFRGFDPADNAMLGRWAEATIRGVEGFLGVSVPFRPLEIIRVSANQGEPLAEGRILKSQGIVNGLLHQKLVLMNPELVTQEELREALVDFLVTRCASESPSEAGTVVETVRIPAWLAAGVAGNIDAAARAARGEAFMQPNDAGVLRVADIVSASDPIGTGTTKAKRFRNDAGWLVAWLDTLLQQKNGWSPILDRLASGSEITLDWLSDSVIGERTARAVEKRWELWFSDQAELSRSWQAVDFGEVIELKRRLEVYPADYGVQPAANLPARVSPADLIPYRGQPWARTAASRARWELERFAVGKPEALNEVVQRYDEFLRGFLHGPGEPGEPPSEGALRAASAIAQEAMMKLEKDVAVRSHYVNSAVPESPAAPPQPTSLSPVEPPPRETVYAPPPTSPAEDAGATLEAQRRRFLEAVLGGGDGR